MLELNEGALSPLSYLKIFFRRKELLIIPSFIGLVLGICVAILLPKEYESSTIIMVEEGKTDNPLFDRLAVSTTVQQRMIGIRESIMGWYSLTELVKRLNLDKEVRTKAEYEELIDKLRNRINIRLRGGNIINLSYTDKDPVATQAVVQNITDIFIGRNLEKQNQETADAIKFIEEQLQVYKGKIKSAEIAELNDRLKALMIDSTEKHPEVRRIKEQIDAKKEELKKENLEYSENIRLGPQTTSPIVDEIKKALDTIDGSAASPMASPYAQQSPVRSPDSDLYQKILLLDKLDNVMARDVRVNDQIYNMLLQRLETAKITQRLQASKEGTKYTIIDPPRVPVNPSKPNKIFIAFIGLFFGIISGVGLVFAAELLDQSFIDVEEAKEYLGVPLLGAISKINTDETLRQERYRDRWLYSMTVIGGVCLVFLTMAVRNFLK